MTNIKELLKTSKYNKVKTLLELAGRIGKSEKLEVYAVGGLVRDLLMDKEIDDIDIMIVGEGILFAKLLANSLGVKNIVSFEKFGTALIPYNPIQIEVASARKENYENHSRNPAGVIYTDLSGDLIRRDFTINSMAIDIRPKKFGELYDPFGGVSDIKNKLIRTPLEPSETFSDDPLRIMRGAYFASKFNFCISEHCFDAMKEMAGRIKIVSWERIRDEFLKILSTKKPSVGLLILQKTNVLETIFPEIHVMYGMEQTAEWHHKDIFDHTLQVVDNAAQLSDKMELRFAALVHDIAKPNTRRIHDEKGYTFHGHDVIGERMLNKVAQRLKLSNRLTDYLKKLTLLHLRPIALAKSEVTDSAIRRLMIASGNYLDDLMILCRADITTKNPNRVKRYLKNFQIVETKMADVIERDAMKSFQSPVRGKEIMSICGLTEGRKVGEIKGMIEEAILDGKIENTYDASKEYLLQIKDNF
ncbi:MAG: tRNA nucleotidyltransferase [Candidatus Marinimicrobia bacterium]|nr:tRNA nucleotidyltransferase [Candidatus Neomarinimicrobiota bacterium]|tara:strand:+ start:15091 stop:16509 length:1419 start_codon:yes stop_codon:yes gene_type:complete